MPRCSVVGCTRGDDDLGNLPADVHFHMFPDSKRFPRLFCAWFKFCSNPHLKLNRTNYVCSDHFLQSDYNETDLEKQKECPDKKLYIRLKSKACPTVLSKPTVDEAQDSEEEFANGEDDLQSSEIPVNCELTEVKMETEEHFELKFEVDNNTNDTNGTECTGEWNMVDDLLAQPFNQRSQGDKKLLMNMPVPRPEFKEAESNNFNTKWFERVDWMTGSDIRKKLYCWTCLLFPQSYNNDLWQQGGFDNFGTLARAVRSHQSSISHMTTQIEYAMVRSKENSASTVNVVDTPLPCPRDVVTSNRSVLKQVLDIVLELARRNMVVPCENDLAANNMKDVFDCCTRSVAAVRCSQLFSHPLLYRHVLDAVSQLLTQYIQREINTANFISLQFRDVSKSTSQIAVTLRLTLSNRVVERFFGVHDVTLSALGQFVTQHFVDCQWKMVAQSYEGPFIPAELDDIQQSIHNEYPHALLLHNWSQRLDLTVSHGLYHIFTTRVFFANLQHLVDVILDTRNMFDVEDRTEIKVDNLRACVRYIINNRDYLIRNIQKLLVNSKTEANLLPRVTICLNVLNHFQFVFLLYIFDQIFDHTSKLDDVYNEGDFVGHVASDSMDTLLKIIKNLRTNDNFSDLYHKTKKVLEDTENNEASIKELYYSVMCAILAQLNVRLKNQNELRFMKVVDVKYLKQRKDSGGPPVQLNTLLGSFCRVYNRSGSLPRLLAETKGLHTNERFTESCSSMFDLYKLMADRQMDRTMKEFFAFLQICLALPVVPCPLNEGASIHERITNYTRVSDRLLYDSKAALLYVENQLLGELQRQPDWEHRVIEQYARDRGMEREFLYNET